MPLTMLGLKTLATPAVRILRVPVRVPVRFSSTRPTIYALSTPLHKSAIGVIRVSGSQSGYIFNKLTNTKTPPVHRVSSLRKLISPQSHILLDEALTLFFKGPKSYTGEDLLELHVHGGVAIIKSVLKEIKQLHDPENHIQIRYAANGEFSERAFLNGRFDLTELEGAREMIDAETESQRVSALSSMTGESKQLFGKWRQELLKNIALLTTVIDFGEDHDLEETALLFEDVSNNVDQIRNEIYGFLEKVQRSEILLKGIRITLLGPPNAGKSSLLNAIANKDAAIVSNIAGTTRDAIDILLDINGYKVVVADTAGIRETDVANEIELEGIRRAKIRAFESDVVLVVLPVGEEFNQAGTEFYQYINELKQNGVELHGILSKIDLDKAYLVKPFAQLVDIDVDQIHPISCLTGEGITQVTQALTKTFKKVSLSDKSDPISISERAKDLLINDVVYGIDQFNIWKTEDDVVLATESLRQSVDGIGKITGEAIGIEEILGVVFSSFCIGK